MKILFCLNLNRDLILCYLLYILGLGALSLESSTIPSFYQILWGNAINLIFLP
jgi:hypothetical protein